MAISLRTNTGASLAVPTETTDVTPLMHDQMAGSTMGRGLRSGLAGMSASRSAFMGQIYEAMGMDQAASDAFADADASLRHAQAIAPEINRLEDVHDVSSAGQFVRAKVGEAAGSMGPVLAGAVVGRGLFGRGAGAHLGGGAVALPAEGGESVLTLRGDPTAMARTTPLERTGLMLGRGVVNTALETAVPGMLVNSAGRRVVGAARNPLRTVAGKALEAGTTEAATEVAQEATGLAVHSMANPERDTSGDSSQLWNAAAAGAIGGAGPGALGGALDVAVDGVASLGKAGADVAQRAGDKAGEVLPKVGGKAVEKVKTAASRNGLMDVLRDPEMNTLMEQQRVPVDVARQGVEATAAWLEAQEGPVRKAAIKKATEIMNDPDASEAKRQRAADFLANIDDPASWEGIAHLAALKGKGAALRTKIESLYKRGVGLLKSKLKLNAQRTDADRIIFGHLQNYLDPEVVDDIPTTNKLYSYLREFIAEGDPSHVPGEILDIFPDQRQAINAINSMRGLMVRAGMVEPDDSFSQRLSDGINGAKTRREKAASVLLQLMSIEHGSPSRYQVNELVSRLTDVFNGEAARDRSGKTIQFDTPKGRVWDDETDADLRELFGANYEAAINALGPLLADPTVRSRTTEARPEDLEETPDDELAGEDFGSDAPDKVFQKELSDGGSSRQFVDQGGGKHLFDLGHPDPNVRADIQKRFDEQKKKAEFDKRVVNELNPLQYAEQAVVDPRFVARQLGMDTNVPDGVLRTRLAQRPERALLTEDMQQGEKDRIDLSDTDIVRLISHGKKTRDITHNKKSGLPFDGRDVVYENSTIRRLTNDEARHGRIYVKVRKPQETDPETGEIRIEPTRLKDEYAPISVQELVKLMYERKAEGVFDEKTAKMQSDDQIRALASAGISSLLNSRFIAGIAVKRGTNPDGTPKFKSIDPASLLAMNTADGRSVYLGVAGKEEKAKRSAKELSEKERTATTTKYVPTKPPAHVISILSADPAQWDEHEVQIFESIPPDLLRSYEAWMREQQEELNYYRDEKKKRADTSEYVSDRDAEGRLVPPSSRRYTEEELKAMHKRAVAKAKAEGRTPPKLEDFMQHEGAGTLENPGKEVPVVVQEVDEFAEEAAEKEDNTERIFDEWGNPLHPKERLSLRAEIDMLRRDIPITERESQDTTLPERLRKRAVDRLKAYRERLPIAEAEFAKFENASPPKAKPAPKPASKRSSGAWRQPARTNEEKAAEQEKVATAEQLMKKANAVFQMGMLMGDKTTTIALSKLMEAIDKAMSTGEFQNIERQIEVFAGRLGLDKAKFNKQTTEAQSQQAPGSTSASLNTQKKVRAYVRKVLGPKIKTAFAQTLPQGASGMFHEADSVEYISIALNALDPMSVAHHESMHAFFSRLMKENLTGISDVLKNVANSAVVRRQLEKLLENEPAALAQLNDPEERVAYMYQFWVADPKSFTLGPETKSLFTKITDFIKKLIGIVSEDVMARQIMEAFHNGELKDVSVVGKVLAEKNATPLTKIKDFMQPMIDRAAEMIATSEGLLMSSDNPHLKEIAELFNRQSTSQEKEPGFFQAKSQMAAKYLNRFERAVRDAADGDLADALEALQKEDGVPPKGSKAKEIYTEVRAILDDMLPYMQKAGVPVSKLDNYFPRVWSVPELMSRGDEFKERLRKNYMSELKGLANAIYKERVKIDPKNAKPITVDELLDSFVHSMTKDLGVAIPTQQGVHGIQATETAPGISPFANAVNHRELKFIKNEDFLDFFEKDLVNIVSSYVVQGTKRAEYVRRFGEWGFKLDKMMEKATEFENNRKTPEKMRAARRAVMAMSGVLGYDISPTLRRVSGMAMVYENLRLLPLSLFSSIIDPLGIAIRGGTLKEAGEAFLYGMKELIKGRSDDEKTRLAEQLGTVDASTFLDALGETYSSVYMYGWQRKLNNAIFKFNGMEAWNRAMRISATQSAISFIKRHLEAPNEHSERYLKELGLDPSTTFDMDAPEIHNAIMRWVDGAVLRPNAAQRPAWASDPHWALFFHMKQFMYSFQKTILSRAAHELKHGNVMPIATLALGYVPVMIAADMAKAVLTGFGDEPEWKKGWGPSDYIVNGVQRAGLLGVSQMLVDTMSYGPDSLGGPAVEQGVGVFTDPIGTTALKALPAQGLFG